MVVLMVYAAPAPLSSLRPRAVLGATSTHTTDPSPDTIAHSHCWLALRTPPQEEDQAIAALHALGIAAWHPATISLVSRSGRTGHAHRPLFPTYVFADAHPSFAPHHFVRAIRARHVSSPVAPSPSASPSPIPVVALLALSARVAAGEFDHPTARPDYRPPSRSSTRRQRIPVGAHVRTSLTPVLDFDGWVHAIRGSYAILRSSPDPVSSRPVVVSLDRLELVA